MNMYSSDDESHKRDFIAALTFDDDVMRRTLKRLPNMLSTGWEHTRLVFPVCCRIAHPG